MSPKSRLSRAGALLCLAILASCDSEDMNSPRTASEIDEASFAEGVSASIKDASRDGGTPGFNWMPPFSPRRSSYPAAFDATLQPTVDVCEWVADSCSVTVATMTAAGTADGKVTVDAKREVYETAWHPARRSVDPTKTYRVRVNVQGRALGYADLEVVGTLWGLLGIDLRNFFPLIPGIDLPIRFRLAKGVGCEKPSLRVSLGEGIEGSPSPGLMTTGCGERIAYALKPAEGYGNLIVSLNGLPVPASGSVQISEAARLVAVATPLRLTLPAGAEPIVAALQAALRSVTPAVSLRIAGNAWTRNKSSPSAAVASPTQLATFQALVDEMAKYAEAHPQSAGRDLQTIYDYAVTTDETRANIDALGSVMSGLTYSVNFTGAQQLPAPGAQLTTARTKVLFVNGIWTSAVQAAIQATLLGLAVREAGLPGTTTGGVYNKSYTDPSTKDGRDFACALGKAPFAVLLAVDLLAPQTSNWCRDALGKAGDLVESGYQVFKQSVRFVPATSDAKQLATALKAELENGNRVIAVAHSQGNLMTSEAVATGDIPQALLGNLGIISLATPKPGRPFPGSVGVYDCWVVRGDIIDAVDFAITLPDRIFLLGQTADQSAACSTKRVTNALTAQIDDYYKLMADQVKKCELYIAVGAAGCPDFTATPVVSSVDLHSFDASYLEAYTNGQQPVGEARTQLLQVLRAHQTRLQGANLTLTVSGLPQALAASVTVSGPWAFARTAAGSTVFNSVSYGTYAFQAFAVASGNTTCTPTGSAGSVEITSPAGSTISVAYSCVVTQPTLLSAAPAALSFSAPQAGAIPNGQVSTVSSQNGPAAGLTVLTTYQNGQGWLTTSLLGTTAPASLSVTPSTTNLPPGSYDATVRVSASGGSFTSLSVHYEVASPAVTGFTSISVGGNHSCAMTTRQEVYCWGLSGWGEVGTGPQANPKPTRIDSPIQFTTVSAGTSVTCGLIATGDAYCWGSNVYGELGDNRPSYSTAVPQAVVGGLRFSSISVGFNMACGLTTTGAAYCWGYNSGGGVGDGTTVARSAPVPVLGGRSFVEIAASPSHSCGRVASGAVFCWGRAGLIGDGTLVERLTPTQVAGDILFAKIGVGTSHSCGLSTTNRLYCWGFNTNGQVGVGPVTSFEAVASPVEIDLGAPVYTFSVGQVGTCARTTSTKMFCWGSNYYGGIGDGTTVERSVPTLVSGANVYDSIGMGATFTCARTPVGDVYCWGYNAYGEIGDGTFINRLTPTRAITP